MIIDVAAHTFRIQSEKSELFSLYRLAAYKFRFMAIFAGFLCMRSGQNKPGEVVIEFFFIETQDLKVNTMVIVVTSRTVLTPDF